METRIKKKVSYNKVGVPFNAGAYRCIGGTGSGVIPIFIYMN